MQPEPLLSVKNVTKRFGGVVALDNVSLSIEKGTVHGIIGPNGSGKTTLFNVLSGLLTPETGSVTFKGQDVTRMPPYQRSRGGLARTFQQVRLFTSLTVRQNIVASFLEHQPGVMMRRMVRHTASAPGYVDEVIDFFGLRRFASILCSSLPYGVQKRTEMARALVSGPDLLMLDEPVNGMNAEEVQGVSELLHRIDDELGVTILLIEHNMSLVMNECEIVTVLSHGINLAEGTPVEISNNEQVIEAYLGKRGGRYVT